MVENTQSSQFKATSFSSDNNNGIFGDTLPLLMGSPTSSHKRSHLRWLQGKPMHLPGLGISSWACWICCLMTKAGVSTCDQVLFTAWWFPRLLPLLVPWGLLVVPPENPAPEGWCLFWRKRKNTASLLWKDIKPSTLGSCWNSSPLGTGIGKAGHQSGLLTAFSSQSLPLSHSLIHINLFFLLNWQVWSSLHNPWFRQANMSIRCKEPALGVRRTFFAPSHNKVCFLQK